MMQPDKQHKVTWRLGPCRAVGGAEGPEHLVTGVVFLLILLGLGLRVAGLSFQPLWWDEGYSVWFATHPLTQMAVLTAQDIHPPLYYALLHGWAATLGIGPAALRLLSVIVGGLTIPLLYFVARRMLSAPRGAPGYISADDQPAAQGHETPGRQTRNCHAAGIDAKAVRRYGAAASGQGSVPEMRHLRPYRDAVIIIPADDGLDISIDPRLCLMCEICAHFCPVAAVTLSYNGQVKIIMADHQGLAPLLPKIDMDKSRCLLPCPTQPDGEEHWCRQQLKLVANDLTECPKQCHKCLAACPRQAIVLVGPRVRPGRRPTCVSGAASA